MSLGRFYLIEVAGKEGRFIAETDFLPSGKNLDQSDGLKAIRQHDDAVAVYECIPAEGYMRNVSEEMARAWLAEFDGEHDAVPAFIKLHLAEDDIQDHFEDQSFWDQRDREIARVAL